MFYIKAYLKKYLLKFKLHPVKYSNYVDNVTIFANYNNCKTDVTQNIGLVGLKPLTIALCNNKKDMSNITHIQIIHQSVNLVKLSLKPAYVNLPGYSFYLIENSINYKRRFFRAVLDFCFIYLKNSLQKKHSFLMSSITLQHLFNFCVYPRPVYLLSGINACKEYAFPIDVVGIYENNNVLFSVRKSNILNKDIQNKKEVLLSSAPYKELGLIYHLGKNNSETIANKFSYLSFNELAYPEFCFNVRHLSVISFEIIGEHYCYAAVIKNKLEKDTNKEQLAHLPWFLIKN